MSSQELADASNALQRAAVAVGDTDVEERIYEQSRQYARLAQADDGPDHGRLARHENSLHELIEETDGDARDHIERALELAQSYREGVEGV